MVSDNRLERATMSTSIYGVEIEVMDAIARQARRKGLTQQHIKRALLTMAVKNDLLESMTPEEIKQINYVENNTEPAGEGESGGSKENCRAQGEG